LPWIIAAHGDSPRTPGRYRVADYAQHTAAFLRASFSEPVIVCGHSLGAMVALSLAAECGSLIAGAILEDPPFHTMGRDIVTTPYLAQFIGMLDVARRGGSIPALTDALARIRINEAQRLGDVRDRAALEFSARCLARVDPGILEPLVAGQWLDGFHYTALWHRVKCPMLLLQGDPASGGAFTDADLARAPHYARRIKFNGVGHQIHRTCPAQFVAALREFAK
jgi:pimeloyl-ACP methyl ester carboxylesterase